MPAEHPFAGYGKLYALLLRFYPKPYRDRFEEGMEQTFHDLCRERVAAGASPLPVVFRAYLDTGFGILHAYLSSPLSMSAKLVFRPLLITVALLLIPLALTIRDGNVPNVGWNWSPGDFVFGFVMIFGTGLAFELLMRKSKTVVYRMAVALGLGAAFLLVWGNAAVGLIGDGPVNLLYFIVIAVGFLGSIASRFEPRPMSYTMFAVAAAQFLIPIVALMIWGQNIPWSPGVLQVLVLNGGFVVLFLGSGLLFRQAIKA